MQKKRKSVRNKVVSISQSYSNLTTMITVSIPATIIIAWKASVQTTAFIPPWNFELTKYICIPCPCGHCLSERIVGQGMKNLDSLQPCKLCRWQKPSLAIPMSAFQLLKKVKEIYQWWEFLPHTKNDDFGLHTNQSPMPLRDQILLFQHTAPTMSFEIPLLILRFG